MPAALAPILFDDDDQANAAVARTSIVAPAQRSAKARHKAAHKLTSDGLPVHSFQSLLADLATVVKNTVQPKPLICASQWPRLRNWLLYSNKPSIYWVFSFSVPSKRAVNIAWIQLRAIFLAILLNLSSV